MEGTNNIRHWTVQGNRTNIEQEECTNNVRHLMVKERTTMPLVVDGNRTNIEQKEGVDDGLIAIQ